MNTESTLPATDSADLLIVYDGECPFCSNYVRILRLREAAGAVQLVDARSQHELVSRFGGRVYYGDECLHLLALLSTDSGLFNRMNNAVFRSRTLSRVLYPVLRSGRNLTLKLLGRTKIPSPGGS